jgi:hypothetical protein
MIGENIPPSNVAKNITSKSKSIAVSFQVCRRSLPWVRLGYFRSELHRQRGSSTICLIPGYFGKNVLVIVVPLLSIPTKLPPMGSAFKHSASGAIP